MPMWTCDHSACLKPAVRTYGECVLCNRHLCCEHLQPPFHNCPKWEHADRYDPLARAAEESEVNALIDRIKSGKLAKVASALRNGVGATIPALQYDRATRNSVMGGMNYHVDICFDDGVVWMARIRRYNATSPPLTVQDCIVQSEVATLKFLERTGVPVPKVYGFALSTDDVNQMGTGYILMEKMTGRSFDKSRASKPQMEKMLEQLADIYIKLSNHPLQLMGSFDEPGTDHLGSFARESLMDFDGSSIAGIGPCSSQRKYYSAFIQLVLDLILKREMYTEKAVDAYLIHRFLLDVLSRISTKTSPNTRFFLKHADDKGDQILVDEEYNITGIIDWEWAYTAPVELAFNSPILLLPVSRFYDGEQNISEDEAYLASCFDRKGNKLLANAVRTGRIHHFFAFCCGYDLSDWEGFLGLFKGLRTAVDMDADMDWDEWKAKAIQRYCDDKELQTLRQAEPKSG